MYSLLETINFDQLLARFPRAALSLFAFCCCCLCVQALIVGASLCFECQKLRDGIVSRVFAGAWDLLSMSCCCAGLFNFDCGLSWLVTAAPPRGRPAAWHVERRLFGSSSSADAGLGNRLTAEEAACFVYAVLYRAWEELHINVEFCSRLNRLQRAF